MSLQGKTALVTGSGGGLGEALAESYLAKGANIVVCDVNQARLDGVKAEFEKSDPSASKVLVVQVDVSDEESVKKLVATTVDRFGTLDFVINNAGIMDKFDAAGTCDKEVWDRVIAVNLTGPFLVTKHAVQVMEKQGSGLIVNIGSNASTYGLSAGAAYTASKHGISGLTKNTAAFYGRKGLHCVALLLGGMAETSITDAFAQGINMEGMQLMQEKHPAYEAVPLAHVVNYVGFLSEEGMSASVNGSLIPLNRGWPAI